MQVWRHRSTLLTHKLLAWMFTQKNKQTKTNQTNQRKHEFSLRTSFELLVRKHPQTAWPGCSLGQLHSAIQRSQCLLFLVRRVLGDTGEIWLCLASHKSRAVFGIYNHTWSRQLLRRYLSACWILWGRGCPVLWTWTMRGTPKTVLSL